MTASTTGPRRALHAEPPRTTDIRPLPYRLAFAIRGPARAYLRRRYDVRLSGVELVPRRGAVILAPNHVGILDGPLLGAFAPRMVHQVGKVEAFTGLQGFVLRRAGQIPVDRWVVDSLAVRAALRVLRDGRALCVYPEGRRWTGDFAQVRTGVAYLALVTGAPILPVALLGTRAPGQDIESVPPPGTRIDVVFGEPVSVDPVSFPRRQFEVRTVTEEIGAILRTHVQKAVVATGNRLPGPPAPSKRTSLKDV